MTPRPKNPLTYEERASFRDAVETAAGAENTPWQTRLDCDWFVGSEPDIRQLAATLADSTWFAEYARRIRVDALREAAAAWPTATRDMVSRSYVRDWLLDRAAVEAGEPRVLPAGRPVTGPTTPLIAPRK